MVLKKRKRKEEYVRPWQLKLGKILEVLIFTSGLYQTFFGEQAIGLLILLTWSLIVFPQFFSRDRIKYIPIEIEILLFFMVLFQFVVGEARDWYTNVPYYDKFVHFMLPMFIGLIGFLIIYTLYLNKKLIATKTTMVVLIVLVTLGVGAAWELVEYASDEILYPRIEGWHHFQGSLTEDALHDTMNDLIMDTLGALTGALLGLYFITRSERRAGKRLSELTEEVYDQLESPKKS